MPYDDFYQGDQPMNYEQKCACSLVLDVSGSMSGEPMEQLNMGLQQFYIDILQDITALSRLEVQLITFSDVIRLENDFALMDEDYVMPHLKASGSTRLVDGVRAAIKSIEARKVWYKESGQTYYRPYIILISDGSPDQGQDVKGLAEEIRRGVENKNFNFWSFGVGNVNMNVLKELSHPNFPPLMLKGLEFIKFFKWLSNSMGAVTHSKEGEKIDITPKSEGENPFQITI